MGKTERSKWAGAHESTRATSEFQLLLTYSTSSRHGGQAKAGSDAPLAQPQRIGPWGRLISIKRSAVGDSVRRDLTLVLLYRVP